MYVELVSKAEKGEPADAARVATARAKAPICLETLSDFLGDGAWIAGDRLTLADLHVAPMLDYFVMVPEGQEMFSKKANLAEWWQRVSGRESIQITFSSK
ncbi:glutathione S-transferase-like protein [Rhizobium sp. PP-CC-3G-465]|nr:glutathione S-transferase-like protein [Rhizobium sp. PP-CC-3G-465]